MRLHEVSKFLGVPSKNLIADCEKLGFKYSTHMAVLDPKAFELLKTKYPKLKDMTAALSEKSSEDKPKRASRVRVAKSKVVTSRTASKKAEVHAEPDDASAEAEKVKLLQRDEGNQGTVTLEQRVVGGGVLRRRRVENPPPVVPSPTIIPEEPMVSAEAAPEIVLEEATEVPELEEVAVVEEQTLEVIQEATEEPVPEPVEVPAPPALVETPTVVPPVVKPPVPASPAPRNLSAAPRLKIVEQPANPVPINRTDPRAKARAAAATAVAPVKPAGEAAAPVEQKFDDKGLPIKKKVVAPVRGAELPNKLTKKDLLGMMEEVEITRPLLRKTKKHVQKNEQKKTQITTPSASKRKIRIENDITVMDLADRMAIKAAELVRKLISMGQMVSVQHRLDYDTAVLVASDYGYEVQNVAETAKQFLEGEESGESENLEHRPPIVTVMGHVDHGKTSLLDSIRKARVAAGEAGGITQHIGAYQVVHNGKKITFIDTPGHAAFTSMRARGAKVTDLVILVVAADEGVKPQTLEALAHAKSAKVPIIVAINKMDKPDANPDRVTQELSGHGLLPEAWGGDTMYVKVAAIQGQGIPELLEAVLLQAEVLDLKADPKKLAKGIVIESRLDKGKGPVASMIVQSGTLEVGQYVVCGVAGGKVRAMLNERGENLKSAGPSTPVEFLGLDTVPNAGDVIHAVSGDAVAKRAQELSLLALGREEAQRASRVSLEDMFKKMQEGSALELRLILKGDVQGSLEAIYDSLTKIKNDKVSVNVIYKAVGAISESDVDLALASGSIIFGFNVRPAGQAKESARQHKVQIKTYEIIYELMDEVKRAMTGLLEPVIKEQILGTAEVREVFTVSKVGPVAGSMVKSGKIVRGQPARLLRDNVVIFTSKISSLRRFKDDAKEVAEGTECGIRLDNYTDIKAGDVIECFENIEIAQAV